MVTKQTFKIPDEERTTLITEETGFFFNESPLIAFENATQQPECQFNKTVFIPYSSIRLIIQNSFTYYQYIHFQLPGKTASTHSFPLSGPSDLKRFELFLQHELKMTKQRERESRKEAVSNFYSYIAIVLIATVICLVSADKQSYLSILLTAGFALSMIAVMMLYRLRNPPFQTSFTPTHQQMQY